MARNYVTSFRGDVFRTPSEKILVKDEPVTPLEEDFGDHNHLEDSIDHGMGMRKSLSMNDIATMREEFMDFNIQSKEEVYQRHQRRGTNYPQELSKTKFVSMAEAVYHYQRDTPGRFHSTRPQAFRPAAHGSRTGLTVAQSPMLRCRSRSRPLHVMSQKEKEELELEEIRKIKIKANPIPKAVMEGSSLPIVPKRPTTVLEPFNLTEVQKKPPELETEQIAFKARPAPKGILEKAHIPPKPPVHITQPMTPNFCKKRAEQLKAMKLPANFAQRQKSVEKFGYCMPRDGPIKPIPFSFEKRDEEMRKRRDERVKKQIEDERKQASQFKAQPLPGAVKKQMRSAVSKGSSSAASSSSENKENFIKFEAKPPLVLYKQPFKPVHKQDHIVKMAPFKLTTEKRAAEREKFDKQLKDKEEEQERQRRQREQELEMKEELAKTELRARLVHRANPVPDALLKPFVPEKSAAPVTFPETPKFVRRLNQK